MMRMTELACPFCLERRASLRHDVRGRPYLRCACGVRAFVPNALDAAKYVAVTESLLSGHLDMVASDAAYAAKTNAVVSNVAAAYRETLSPRSDRGTELLSSDDVDNAKTGTKE